MSRTAQAASPPPPPPQPPAPPPTADDVTGLACAVAERNAGVPPDLIAFRAREGKPARERKLRELWELLPLKDSVRAAPGPNPETGGWVGNSIFGPSVYRPPGEASSSNPTSSAPNPTPGSTPSSSSSGNQSPGPSSLSSAASTSAANVFSAIQLAASSVSASTTGLPSPTSSSSFAGSSSSSSNLGFSPTLSPERAAALRDMYQEELVRRCSDPHAPDARQFAGEVRSPEDSVGKGKEKVVDWKGFRTYLWERESELWKAFHDLDRDDDGFLGMDEMQTALKRADITLTPATLQDFVSFLASNSSSSQGRSPNGISWIEFRDMFLLLPRSASVPEIYRFYQVRKLYSDGRGAARLNSDGDISPSFPSSPPKPSSPTPEQKEQKAQEAKQRSETAASSGFNATEVLDSNGEVHRHGVDSEEEEEEEETDSNGLSGAVALKFLAAGGLAGAVSRTATAPFDRLKVFLITDTGHHSHLDPTAKTVEGLQKMKAAIARLYSGGGGLRAFWVGNGLNVLKIMPESAIKFFSYESSKRMLARYWDHVDDPTQISGSSRFLAGGLGGIISQFAIYPLETLKTAHMTTAGSDHSSKVLLRTAAHMWSQGGVRRYYRGLTLGLIGVFPYAAIDMSTFETLKISYCSHFHLDEPDTMAVLTFGAISGGVGASSVYPINVIRTKLQAAGSTGHPQEYTGFLDVVKQTHAKEGWRGFYKGLTVNLAKVIPAVSISYVVYENSKKSLGL